MNSQQQSQASTLASTKKGSTVKKQDLAGKHTPKSKTSTGLLSDTQLSTKSYDAKSSKKRVAKAKEKDEAKLSQTLS